MRLLQSRITIIGFAIRIKNPTIELRDLQSRRANQKSQLKKL